MPSTRTAASDAAAASVRFHLRADRPTYIMREEGGREKVKMRNGGRTDGGRCRTPADLMDEAK